MPELPEVETLRGQLATRIAGETILAVSVTGHRTIRRQPREEFVARLTGRMLRGVGRWGKFLLLGLDGGETLVVHLRMSGQLCYAAAEAEVAPHTHLTMELSSSAQLRFVDPRTFGELFVADEYEGRGLPIALAHLGIDPIHHPLTPADVGVLFANRRIAVKTLLLDQRCIAGIGNIYGDEICFLAGVRPTRRAGGLTRRERERIAHATGEILQQAISERGSSLKDQRYRDLDGGLGTYQQRHRVYARTGLPCVACASPIRRTVVGGRSAHFCPSCQH